ncbi:MAG: hypothetical protein DBX60_08050 [Bacillota bacterium]|nr:MAG: hypothetical protein DBX60_08050 [Bacillota bacterium]
MPRFFTMLAKHYDPANVDKGMFSMFAVTPHAVPLIATSEVDPNSGIVTVDGKPVSKGKCIKFDFSPLPFYFVPVGEVAREFGKTYTVKLSGFRNKKGKKFAPCTFRLVTETRGTDDGKHKENEAAAKEVSDEGIVLLKNDGTLPLAVGERVALLGAYQDFRLSAVGAALIKPRWQLTFKEALERAGFSVEEGAQTALYVLSRRSGENQDNKPIAGEYYLTEGEKEELAAAVRQYKHVILVLNTGYPVEMKWLSSLPLAAILWTGFCGQRGTESLADILCGKVNPSGRLADTWPYDYYDLPAAHNFVDQDENSPVYSDDGKKMGVRVFYEEEQFVGYRYFDTFQNKNGGQFDQNRNSAAFLFGHGLSYTKFSLSASAKWTDGALSVTAEVCNVGERAGKESVLVYVGSPSGRLKKPVRSFAGFEKTRLLSPNESETLTLEIPAKDFAVYDDKARAFVLEAGEYTVYAGGGIGEAEKIGSFILTQEQVVEKTCSVLPPVEEVKGISAEGSVSERTRMVPRAQVFPVRAAYQKKACHELPKYRGPRILFTDVKAHPEKLDDFVSQFSLKELVDFVVCNGSCFGPKQSGAAGKLAHSEKYGVPTYYMSDGNSSVNLNRRTTGFPSSNVLAGTFNKQLAYKVGEVLAKESKEYGIAINLGPGGNLHRNLLCGRHPEYFSEDPILTGTMMAFQARGQEENGVRATYKHFLANGSELERKSSHSIMNERTLRELYLRVFDKAFSLCKPSCVMTSYNAVNGIYPSESAPLLHDLLRKRWGFDGFVMTDWGAVDYTADPVRSLNAGTDLLTPGGKKMFRRILRAAKRGEISKETLQNSVKHILKVLLQCE